MTVPETLLREADEVARAEGRSRSELFREAVRRYVRGGAGLRKHSKPLLARLARLAVKGPRIAADDIDEILYRRRGGR
ncbi:MAG: CopG family ribbon-helix-helix protein [Thermoanaerobaculia bacterium]